MMPELIYEGDLDAKEYRKLWVRKFRPCLIYLALIFVIAAAALSALVVLVAQYFGPVWAD